MMVTAFSTATEKAVELSKYDRIVILCGHYEGVDQRAIDEIVDEEISIGDYILTGGELAAMVLTDAVTVQAQTTAEQRFPMVTALEIGDPVRPDPQRPSLILCRAGERSLWELAKQCGSTVDAICRANQLTGEPAADKILLIPVQ